MAIITGTEFGDYLVGDSADDEIHGFEGSDTLDSGGGNDVLDGGDGDDTLVSRGGVDTVDGGSGNDTWIGYYDSSSTDLALVQAGGGSWSMSNGTTLSAVESVWLYTGSGNDSLTLQGLAGFEVFDGGSGDDTLRLDDSTATNNAFVSFQYDNGVVSDGVGFLLFSNVEIVNLTTGSGNDYFQIYGANNGVTQQFHFDGGAGNDFANLIFSSATVDITLYLNATPAEVASFVGVGGTLSNVESVYAVTGSGDDTIIGTDGDDQLGAGTGANTVSGGGGNDTIYTYGGIDTVDGGSGDDFWQGAYNGYVDDMTLAAVGDGAWTLSDGTTLAGIERVTIHTGSGDDNLTGGNGNDVLDAGEGDNTLSGGGGDDSLYSRGGGVNTVDGGEGNDYWFGDYQASGANLTASMAPSGSWTFSDGTSVSNVEHVLLIAGAGDDTFSIRDTPNSHSEVYAQAGFDTLNLDFSASTVGGYVYFGGGSGSAGDGSGAYASYGGFESFSATTGAGDDFFQVDASGAHFDLDGGAGADYASVTVYVPNDVTFVLDATPGAVSTFVGAGDTLTDIERVNIATGDGNDSITAGDGEDILTSYGGDDILVGGGGNDFLDGGSGANTLLGGDGNDQIHSSFGEDTVDGGAGNDVWEGWFFASVDDITLAPVGDGAWTLSTGGALAGIERIDIRTGSGNDILTGSNGNDFIDGGWGNNTLSGGAGDDQLFSYNGVDTVDGGSGNDAWQGFYNAFGDNLTFTQGAAGAWTLSNGMTLANVEEVTFYTGYGDDTFNLNSLASGRTQLYADGGQDTLNINLTAETDDVTVGWYYTYSTSYVIDGAGGEADFTGMDALNITTGSGNDAFYNSTGNLTIDAGAGTDTLYLTGQQSNYTIAADGAGFVVTDNVGGDGVVHILHVEQIQFADSLFIIPVPIYGTGGNDTLTGTPGADAIYGLAGNDILSGLGSTDFLYGGDGKDTLEGGDGDDTLDGGAGVDTASYAGAAAGVTVSLSVAGPQATGGAGTDILSNLENITGSSFNDTLEGSAADNVLNGGTGVNTVSYARAGSAVTVDLNIAQPQNTVGAGVDTLKNFTNLIGSAFGDTLTGSTKDNVINGGDGDDLITGGKGADTLIGGLGADRFIFVDKSDSKIGGAWDTIADFSSADGDKLDLSVIDANTLISGNQAFTLVAGFTHVAGQLVEIAQGSGYMVEGDLNGDGLADFAIFVNGQAPGASDFVF
jgi:Ca2+-binding RTX toxin-like protein